MPRPKKLSPVTAYIAQLSPSSKKPQWCALNTIARRLAKKHTADTYPWHRMRYRNVVWVRSWLEARYKPATARRHMAAMRMVFQECVPLGLITTSRLYELMATKNIPGDSELPGHVIGLGDIGAMMTACGDSPLGHRDRAVLAVLCGAGLRVVEAARLSVESINLARMEIMVLGKGLKHRVVPISAMTAELICPWMTARTDRPGPLFPQGHTLKRDVLEPLTTSGIRKLITRLSGRALGRVVTPHDLRRTYITRLLEVGADVITVSNLVGHVDPKTTKRYDYRKDDRMRAAVEGAG